MKIFTFLVTTAALVLIPSCKVEKTSAPMSTVDAGASDAAVISVVPDAGAKAPVDLAKSSKD